MKYVREAPQTGIGLKMPVCGASLTYFSKYMFQKVKIKQLFFFFGGGERRERKYNFYDNHLLLLQSDKQDSLLD